MAMKRIAQKKAYEIIASQLTKRIQSGSMPHGSVLPSERELATRFDASRTTIREALFSLQSAGLVILSRSRKARVSLPAPPTFLKHLSSAAQTLLAQKNGMTDFQEARILFECGLVRYAARHATPKDIERLAIALADNRKSFQDHEQFTKTDVAFHDVIAEIPGNSIFSALSTAMEEWLANQRRVVLKAPVRGIMKRAYQGHEIIFDAISKHDPEAAEMAMLGHLTAMSDAYWKSRKG